MEPLSYKKRILLELTSSRFWMGLLGAAVCVFMWIQSGEPKDATYMWGVLAALGIYSISKAVRA